MQADRYVRHPKAGEGTTGSNAEAPPPPPQPTSWRGRYALGLPEGSVRALLALALFGSIWGLLALRPDQPLPGYLRDLLFIVLGHYFAARKSAPTDEARVGPPPLFLPRGTIRLLLIGGFVVVGARLYSQGVLDDFQRNPAGLTLLLVGGFLLGVVAGRVRRGISGDRPPARWLEDAKALVALAAVGLLALLVWSPQSAAALAHVTTWLTTRLGPEGPEELLAATIGFYFGNRS